MHKREVPRAKDAEAPDIDLSDWSSLDTGTFLHSEGTTANQFTVRSLIWCTAYHVQGNLIQWSSTRFSKQTSCDTI